MRGLIYYVHLLLVMYEEYLFAQRLVNNVGRSVECGRRSVDGPHGFLPLWLTISPLGGDEDLSKMEQKMMDDSQSGFGLPQSLCNVDWLCVSRRKVRFPNHGHRTYL